VNCWDIFTGDILHQFSLQSGPVTELLRSPESYRVSKSIVNDRSKKKEKSISIYVCVCGYIYTYTYERKKLSGNTFVLQHFKLM